MAKKSNIQPRRSNEPTRTSAPSVRASVPSRQAEKRRNVFTEGSRDMLFGRRNFMLFGAGLGLVLLGLLMMAGGAQPDPNVWDDQYPYSFRRITLAPILMVAGFVVSIWGIFARGSAQGATQTGAEGTSA